MIYIVILTTALLSLLCPPVLPHWRAADRSMASWTHCQKLEGAMVRGRCSLPWDKLGQEEILFLFKKMTYIYIYIYIYNELLTRSNFSSLNFEFVRNRKSCSSPLSPWAGVHFQSMIRVKVEAEMKKANGAATSINARTEDVAELAK